MNKFYWLIFPVMALAFAACGADQTQVEIISEEGVDVVLNQLKPHRVEGEASDLTFEELFSIDTEDAKILETGLTDIETFDVDSAGNIYAISWRSNGDYIYKFDPQGNFVTSFARRGDGPGEMMFGGTVQVWSDTTLMAKDPTLTKFQTFSLDGEFLREMPLKERFSIVQILRNGSFLITWQRDVIAERKRVDYVGLCSVIYEPIKEFDSHGWIIPEVADRVVVGMGSLVYAASRDFIYVGNPDREYDIWVFDPEGSLVRKIRKEYKPVRIPSEYQESVLSRYPEGSAMRQKIVFRTHWVPFRYFIADDEGRLYAMTYEDGENTGEAVYDVFNPGGIFLTRAVIANKGASRPLPARILGGRLYCVAEKENGHKTLVVSSTLWE
jgi:hypothetical protein